MRGVTLQGHFGGGIGFQSSFWYLSCELRDLDGLVRGDVAKHLGRPAGRPVDLEGRNPVGLGQANGLLERICPPTAA